MSKTDYLFQQAAELLQEAQADCWIASRELELGIRSAGVTLEQEEDLFALRGVAARMERNYRELNQHRYSASPRRSRSGPEAPVLKLEARP